MTTTDLSRGEYVRGSISNRVGVIVDLVDKRAIVDWFYFPNWDWLPQSRTEYTTSDGKKIFGFIDGVSSLRSTDSLPLFKIDQEEARALHAMACLNENGYILERLNK